MAKRDRNVEDLLHERGIDVSYETKRFWWNKFGPMFASEITRNRVQKLRAFSKWQWHVDEVFVKCCQTNSNSSQFGQGSCPLCHVVPLAIDLHERLIRRCQRNLGLSRDKGRPTLPA